MFNREKSYSVYIKSDADEPIETAMFIEDGFSFMAFIFNALWAIFHRVWNLLLICILLTVAIEVAANRLDISRDIVAILNFSFYLWVGFEANDWRAASLEKKGYTLYDVVIARNSLDAKQRFFDTNLEATPNIRNTSEGIANPA